MYKCRLKERERVGKRGVEDLHIIAKLQDKLNERDQLIKRLVVSTKLVNEAQACILPMFIQKQGFLFVLFFNHQEELHQLSQHPSLSSDGTVKSYHPRTHLGGLTPTMKVRFTHHTQIL